MIPSRFEYHAPESIEAAVALLTKLGDDAKVLSGGQSLIPMMKLRLAAPAHIVDINRVPGLASLRESDGALHIGALVRETDLEESEIVRTRYPILADAARHIGDPLVRNLATLCGNLAHGDPANDHPAVMLALDAVAVVVGPEGRREVPLRDFFTGLYSTALAPNEILVEVKIPTPPPRSGGAYVKMERKVGDFATVAVGAQLTLGTDGACQRAGIGLTNVGPTPIKAVKAEMFMQGKAVNEGAIKEAARAAAEESRPTADNRGSVEYKRDLVRVLTARALRKAADRAAERR
ncbi:MAG TPA: xanthine dehydrogenase family protein subunit M [Methylomirabilota bacterium]|jgi:carbon-monoxide dehydrogenase medium subunit